MNDNDAQPLREEVRRLRLELEASRAENALLRQELDRLAGRIYGKKSEQLSADQLQLLFQELVAPGPAQGTQIPHSRASDGHRRDRRSGAG